MRKHIFIMILISSLILSSGCIKNINQTANLTSTNTNKTFQANGITFNYPSDWKSVNKTDRYVIARIIDPMAKSNDKKTGAVVEISKKESSGIPLERFYDEVKSGASSVAGYQLLSESSYKVDNVTAYEFIAKASDKNVEEQYRIVLLEKKGFIYMIACGTRSPTYLGDKSQGFDMIISSFKVINI